MGMCLSWILDGCVCVYIDRVGYTHSVGVCVFVFVGYSKTKEKLKAKSHRLFFRVQSVKI